MKEITLLFTQDELRELAKQLYLARSFFISCDYDNQYMVDDIMNRVCATGFAEAPETGGFSHGGYGETTFFISDEVADECEPLIELYEDYAVEEYLPYRLADRDFLEQYGTLDPEEILHNPALLSALKAIQNKYLQEFETYGVIHLRLPEKE
jgi:hypothetical protein